MIKVLFYIRKSKTNSDGLAPVSNGLKMGGRAIGSVKEVKLLNEFLDVLAPKLWVFKNI